MSTINKILNSEGEQILPITSTEAVLSPDSTETLENRLSALEEEAIESVSATQLLPTEPPTAQIVNNELQLGIPKGDKGDDAITYFQGWYSS
jgi:hypothetical protein